MSMTQPGKALLGVQNVSHSYGAQSVLKDISVTLHEGDRISLTPTKIEGAVCLL